MISMVLAAALFTEANMNDVYLTGYVGDAIDRCVRNHVMRTDPLYLTGFFHSRTETWMWQSEFWGKWMHAAQPFADYTGCPLLKANIEKGLEDLLSTQDADGYIGNYGPEKRYAQGCWDVWGTKYTLLGLIHAYDSSKDEAILSAAEKLAGCLMNHFKDKDLYKSGWYRGMPSCSTLEPIMWLYKRTGKEEYLTFAKYIREQMDKEDGARLIRDCDKVIFERITEGDLYSSLKAYEMMSCYQGLLELYEVTGEEELLEAVIKSVKHIIAEEINICGGAASAEHWYSGYKRQTEEYNHVNETCVLTTWMRLCEKLFTETGDQRYFDEIEKCFYNAFLASMKPDGSVFAMYAPLSGTRCTGEHHCRAHTNCCNANGPRGFLVFLKSLLASKAGEIDMNLYASGFSAIDGVKFQTYTRYPENGLIEIWYRSSESKRFKFVPRIPGWCKKYTLKLNDKEEVELDDLDREWEPGDKLTINLEMKVEKHLLNDHIAFTYGPVALARDLRFGGNIHEVVRPSHTEGGSGDSFVASADPLNVEFAQLRPSRNDLWMEFAAVLPMANHSDSPEQKQPAMIRFTDFASAGNTWDESSSYLVWLPLLKFESRR